ncbi:MAG TPA: M43 family zinc metalloprotease, partial [Polyangiaceae bacterium]|nr:M43 family zinc metalloprotease [Polyangiaceae bacterium]
ETCLAGNCEPPPSTDQKLCLAQDALAGNLRADPTAPARALELEKDTQIYLKQQRMNPESFAYTNVTTIPVVVHVLEHPTVPAVTDQDIADMLEELNQRYRQVTAGIRPTFAGVASSLPLVFELASRSPSCGATTGIERVATSVEEFPQPALTLCSAREWTIPAKGGAAAWDPTKYLNIWIAKLTNDFLAGMATFPTQAGQPCDGFLIQPTKLDDGVVPAHEIGHYFNLLHTETPNDGVVNDQCEGGTPATCATEGDLICDTPATTEEVNRCALDLNTCVDSPSDLPDQIENYMYSTTTGCRSMFTTEQVLRLEESLSTTRIGLLGSDGFVPPVANPLGDLWSRDGLGDEGQEPNDLEVAWTSDDIWIRRQVDDKQQHEDAVYRPGNPNHVFVRVRNRGCQPAEGKTVTLRWAKASTNLGWPAPWDGSETLPGTSAPMGNVIGTQAVGTLGPGESTVLEFAWEPPNPQDYASLGADATHFCLLSQIGEHSTAPQDLATLVRSSNDIAWKNVTVAADSTALDAAGMMEGDSEGSPQQMRITEPDLPGTPGSVFKWGDVTIDLGTTLFARWVEGGSQASGPVSVAGTSVTLSQATTLQHIMLRAEERAVFHVKFAPAAAYTAPNRSIADVYRLDVTQLTEAATPARALGGIRFLLKTRRPLSAQRPPDDPK